MSDVTCRFMCVVIFVPCLQPAQLETIGEVVYSYQYKYISIYIFKRVCVLCACVNVHLYVFMCMCLSLCVCVCICVCKWLCACVCVCPSVWCVCACVCCKILAARITFHVCVCVWQRWTLSPREYSRTQKRENSHSRTQKIEPTAAARHPCLGYCAPHEIRISIQWIC